MKIGIIDHSRCHEPTFKRTLVWLPDDMTPDQFAEAVKEAEADYLSFAAAFKNEDPPNNYRPHSPAPYRSYPDRTVAEIDREWAEKRAVYEAWDTQRQLARRTFVSYLDGRHGIVSFYKAKPEDFTIEVEWGHKHGWTLDYGETEYDG